MVKAVDGSIWQINIEITLSAMKGWKNGRLKRTIKELSQFDNKKPEELESECDHFDGTNSYPTWPFKGRNLNSSVCRTTAL